MKKSGQCPKCESTNILRDVKAIDHGHGNAQWELCLGVDRNPTAVFFTGQQRSAVSAWLCADCGYVEFYADDPRTLASAALVAKGRHNG